MENEAVRMKNGRTIFQGISHRKDVK